MQTGKTLYTIVEGTNAVLVTDDCNKIGKFLFCALGREVFEGLNFRTLLRYGRVTTFHGKGRSIQISECSFIGGE